MMKAQIFGPADFREMPWANGKGSTVELRRCDAWDGAMLWRLSMAAVVEDGAFSIFDGIERNLTVIEGPGFDLVVEGLHLRDAPLVPVAFAGDLPVRAQNVVAAAIDFNVMVARRLGDFTVKVVMPGDAVAMTGSCVAVFALGETGAVLDDVGQTLGKHALWLGTLGRGLRNSGQSPLIAVRLPN